MTCSKRTFRAALSTGEAWQPCELRPNMLNPRFADALNPVITLGWAFTGNPHN